VLHQQHGFIQLVGSLKTGGQPEECLSAQHVALQNGRDVRAINFSFGETLSATRDQMHFRWQCLANAVY